MPQIKQKGFNRSQTKRQLPTISLHRNQKSHLSAYLHNITQEITANVEYTQMEDQNISREQGRLKNILRKINEDTVKIISEYTPRSVRNNHHNQLRQHNKTTTAIIEVKEKQTQNNERVIKICQNEIQSLKDRQNILQNHSKDDYDQMIRDATAELYILREEIKEIRNENNRRGKEIMSEEKTIQDGKLKTLENDTYLVQLRAERLRSENQRVSQDLSQYQHKLHDINVKYMEAERFMIRVEEKQNKVEEAQNNQWEYQSKNKILSKIKKRKEFNIHNLQYRYYRMLKQMEESNEKIEGANEKINETLISIESSKMGIQRLEEHLKMLKRNKRQKQRNINQFLNHSRLQNGRAASNTANKFDRTRKFENIEMKGQILSEIDLKKEQRQDEKEDQNIKEIISSISNISPNQKQ